MLNAPYHSHNRKWNYFIPCFDISRHFLLTFGGLCHPAQRERLTYQSSCAMYILYNLPSSKKFRCTQCTKDCHVFGINCTPIHRIATIRCYATVEYSRTVQLLCKVVECSCFVFYKSSLYFIFKCTMTRSIHKP